VKRLPRPRRLPSRHLPSRLRPGGIGSRIAAATIGVSILGVAIVAVGALVLGGETFVHLMTADGQRAASARAMFDESVGQSVALALLVAIFTGVALAIWVGHRIARPIGEVATAARRIASGDTAARVPRRGPDELASLSDSFNQMAESLEEQERLRREFVANAAHELRTPLTNLQGYLEALRDGVIQPERATFESLWEEAERLCRLSRSLDLLASGDARRQPAALVPVDVSAAVRSAVELFGPAAARARLHLDTELEPSLPARADPDGLARVLANLLQNAIRYTPAGGAVRVSAERRGADVLVTVANTGPAIPAEELPHLFERFYRVEKSRAASHGGAGIGLAIVRQQVEAFGGQVGAESRDGLNRFWFSLTPVA
jgi:two-component system sensor histidine kinase BaeS